MFVLTLLNMVKFIFTAGPLGSGKTTFINAIAPGLQRFARVGAAISDLGAINDDVRRVEIDRENVAGFKAGCVCCERRQDLENLVGQINPEFDYFIVEPSGASNVYDMIQVIQEARASTRPDFEVSNLFTMVPVSHWDQVKALRALQAGVQSASSIVLTKPDESIEQVNRALDDLGATQSRICYDGKPTDLSNLLLELPDWKIPVTEVEKGHEHFDKISFSIPPNTSREEVAQRLEQLTILGVVRAKGVVPSSGFEFDLSYGDISTANYAGNQIAARGTVIFEGDSAEVIRIINSFDVGGAADVRHGVAGASLTALMQAFHYHLGFAGNTRAVVDGRVRANFEGTDDAYTLGKEIYLKTKGEESSPLELALVPYLAVRYEGLQALRNSTQEDAAYIGVMLGSYMIQMLGEKDDVPFDRLTESAWIQRIKEEVCPTYFEYLSRFGKADLKYFDPEDKHFPFFAWMAERGAPYVDNELVVGGAKNMAAVHNNHFSERWRKLENE